MSDLLQYRNQDIYYNPCVFSEGFITELLQPPKHSSVKLAPVLLLSSDVTQDQAFDAAWEEMSKDQEYIDLIKEFRYTKEQLLANFKQRRTTLISVDDLAMNAKSLVSRYEVEVNDVAFVHRIDGEEVIIVKKNQANSDKVSSNIEIILNTAIVIIDVIIIIAALAGTIIAIQKGQLAGKMHGFWPRVKEFFTQDVLNEINDLLKKKSWLKLLCKIMSVLNLSKNLLRDAVKTVVTSMGVWQWVVIGVSILACILLAIATSGSSISYQIATIIGYFIVLGVDVKALINSIQAAIPAPA